MQHFGPTMTDVRNSSDALSMPVAETATVYTKAIRINYRRTFAIALQMTSANGSVKQTVTIEQSYRAPTTEGSADTAYVLPNGLSVIITDRTAETLYIASFVLVAMPWLRFKIEGISGNNADALTRIRIGTNKEY